MKPFHSLTRLGRLKRLRSLAQAALAGYGLAGARLVFLQYEGNCVFRVDVPKSGTSKPGLWRRTEERYVLRVHTSRHIESIRSELTWLAALRHEAGMPVPEPVPTLTGELLTTASMPGETRRWHISLMRWMKGRRFHGVVSPAHARAWGRALGGLHRFAAKWQPPGDFQRIYLGWCGLYGQEGGLWYPAEHLLAMMPPRYSDAYRTTTRKLRRIMSSLGEGPDAFGLIHGDMYLENVLFRRGEAFIIDFDDSGFGYWMYDIGVALSQWPWTDAWRLIRDSLLEGYTAVHSLPESQLKHLDLFMAAQYAVLTLWGTAFMKANPGMRREHEKWRNRGGENLLRYLALHP